MTWEGRGSIALVISRIDRTPSGTEGRLKGGTRRPKALRPGAAGRPGGGPTLKRDLNRPIPPGLRTPEGLEDWTHQLRVLSSGPGLRGTTSDPTTRETAGCRTGRGPWGQRPGFVHPHLWSEGSPAGTRRGVRTKRASKDESGELFTYDRVFLNFDIGHWKF